MQWTRGKWIDASSRHFPNREYDCLWAGRETDTKPWVFITSETDTLVEGIGYGEGMSAWTFPKKHICWFLIEPVIFGI